jgi:hypothetical protein
MARFFRVMTQVDLGLTIASGLTRLNRLLALMTLIRNLGRHTAAPPLSLLLPELARPPSDRPAAPLPACSVQQQAHRGNHAADRRRHRFRPAKATSRPSKVNSSPGCCPPAKSGRRRPGIPPPVRGRPSGDYIAGMQLFPGFFL